MAFTKLDSGIVDSSIWAEPSDTRIVWITLLAKCDKEGYARLSVSGLQRAANVPAESVTRALATLESPDPDSRTSSNEGRRVNRIEGGWHVLNYALYRNNMKEEAVREYFAEEKRKQRENEKLSKTRPRHVLDVSASASASASKGNGSGKGEVKVQVFPQHLQTPRFIRKFDEWMEVRKAMKKCKDWHRLFNEQVSWISQFNEPESFEIVSASIRNGWQGLFPPKQTAATKSEGNWKDSL